MLNSNSLTIKKPTDYCQARQEHFCEERTETQLEILYDVIKKTMRNQDGYIDENWEI